MPEVLGGCNPTFVEFPYSFLKNIIVPFLLEVRFRSFDIEIELQLFLICWHQLPTKILNLSNQDALKWGGS